MGLTWRARILLYAVASVGSIAVAVAQTPERAGIALDVASVRSIRLPPIPRKASVATRLADRRRTCARDPEPHRVA